MTCLVYIFLLIGTFLANVIIQMALVMHFKSVGLLKSVFISFLCGLIVNVHLGFYIYNVVGIRTPEAFGYPLVTVFAYICLGYCYFHFINMTETARRIRILAELMEFRDGLMMNDILQRYNPKEIIDKRLSRLVNNRQVDFRNGRYYANVSSMTFITKIISSMKLVVLGRRMV